MPNPTTALGRLLDALPSAKPDGAGYRAKCPTNAHNGDGGLNLSIRQGHKGVLLYCHSHGCDVTDILGAIGFEKRDLFDEDETVYRYDDGRIVHRTNVSKKFRQTGNTSGDYIYNRSAVQAAILAGNPVFVCEGEKDCENLSLIAKVVATCNPGGAGKAGNFDWSPLKGANVFVVQDKDEPGRSHAAKLLKILTPIAAKVVLLEAKVGKDATDHLAAYGNIDDFEPVELDAIDELTAILDAKQTPSADLVARARTAMFGGPPLSFTDTDPVPAFPVDALPEWIGYMVDSVSATMQTDPAMAATQAIAVLATCTGGHVRIEVRKGWEEPTNLWCLTTADPGERKSAVQNRMFEPIMDEEQTGTQAGTQGHVTALAQKAIAEAKATRAIKLAASPPVKKDGNKNPIPTTPEDMKQFAEAAEVAAREAEAVIVPPIPRLIADDITPEAMATVLAEQGGRLAVISAEGGIFGLLAGRYTGGQPNLTAWLKGHAGDFLRVDRKNSEPEFVARPALTVSLMIQPIVLRDIASNPTFRGAGLLARFMYALPESMLGRRTVDAPPVRLDAAHEYDSNMRSIAANLVWCTGDPMTIRLTPAAAELEKKFERDIEAQLGPTGELAALTDWGGKYVGAVMRIAAMLHCAEHFDRFHAVDVSADTVKNAIQIGEYFRQCAIIAFERMQTDPAVAAAEYLADRVNALGQDVVSLRDLQRHAKRLRTREDVLSAVTRLVDQYVLYPLPAAAATGGRPQSQRYFVNFG